MTFLNLKFISALLLEHYKSNFNSLCVFDLKSLTNDLLQLHVTNSVYFISLKISYEYSIDTHSKNHSQTTIIKCRFHSGDNTLFLGHLVLKLITFPVSPASVTMSLVDLFISPYIIAASRNNPVPFVDTCSG